MLLSVYLDNYLLLTGTFFCEYKNIMILQVLKFDIFIC